jgi:hypothetical protein
MKRITLSTFRRYDRAEQTLLRGAMPRLAALEPAAAPARVAVETVAARDGSRLVRPLTATVAEVANA